MLLLEVESSELCCPYCNGSHVKTVTDYSLVVLQLKEKNTFSIELIKAVKNLTDARARSLTSTAVHFCKMINRCFIIDKKKIIIIYDIIVIIISIHIT